MMTTKPKLNKSFFKSPLSAIPEVILPTPLIEESRSDVASPLSALLPLPCSQVMGQAEVRPGGAPQGQRMHQGALPCPRQGGKAVLVTCRTCKCQRLHGLPDAVFCLPKSHGLWEGCCLNWHRQLCVLSTLTPAMAREL